MTGNSLVMDADSTPERLALNAQKRAWLTVIWMVVSVLLAVMAIQLPGDGPAARTGQILGVVQLLELVPMLVLVALNFSLRRNPTRPGAAGPAALTMVLLAALALLGIVVLLASDGLSDVAQLPLLLIFLAFAIVPFMLGLGTRLDARKGLRRSGVV